MEVRGGNNQWMGVIEHPEREMDRCRSSHLVVRDSEDDDKHGNDVGSSEKIPGWGVCCAKSFQLCPTLRPYGP